MKEQLLIDSGLSVYFCADTIDIANYLMQPATNNT